MPSVKPVRLLHILRSADVGGIEKLVAQLVEEQRGDPGLEVTVFFVMNGQGRMGQLFQQGTDNVFELGLKSGFSLSPMKFLSAVKRMRKFDVLHIHTFSPLAAAAAAWSGVPILFTEHGNFGFGRKATVGDRIKAILLGFFLRRGVDFVSFNSRFTEGESMRRYGLGAVAKSVIYNGIDLRQKRQTSNIAEDLASKLKGKFVVGTSSRFAGFKRVERLILGFEKFCRNNDKAVLLLVGDGDLRSELESLVAELGIEDKTFFVGYQVNVTAYQALMDVCVFSSQYEPCGLVALEAYELGKPVVVFEDGGGLLEIVGEFESHDVVRDIEGLAERLTYYQINQSLEFGESARRIEYVKRFDMRAVAGEFRKVYSRLYKCAA